MFVRTSVLALLVAVTACSGELPAPTAQEAAFDQEIAPYCGPADPGRASCNVYLVEDGTIYLVTGYSVRHHEAFATYYDDSSHSPIRPRWILASRLGPYELVGPGDATYEDVHHRYLNHSS